ncbi:Pumilio RNA-binding repeat [Cinnamomum micranthum f. kanehirae]|uniref:Pumilio RNA-binding repeat n=1 Tax=Cinnamomum micranthum f. kanehirae TaxID=337451 RepID=A0A443PTW9_9MAGN|nr:Pumilio RNA-binding repeat [Cinnamomum micranthum f. kanehirae]
MAAKEQHQQSQTKKRKRASAAPKQGDKPTSKKPKRLLQAKTPKSPTNKSFKTTPKPSSSSSKPHKHKPPYEKSSTKTEKEEPKSKRELRLIAKEKAEARKKKRKPHYTLQQELASLWEKIRRRNIAKEERSKLISEALLKMKGKIPEIASSHVSSRVLQTCVKYCSQAERESVFEELRPHLLTLARNTYAVHLVKKMLDSASKNQLEGFISSLHGHVASLLRHSVGSVVVEHTFQLGNGSQRQALLLELYSTELQLFKDLTTTSEARIVDLIRKLGLQKSSIVQHMTKIIQPLLEKGIVDHSIIHSVLIEYFSIANKSSAADVIQQLSGPLLVRMIHTRNGAKVGMLCVKHGSAKERKKIIKGMKGHVGKVAHDQYGSMVLVCILSVVDDTKLITKVIIRELQAILKELVLDKNGRRPLLQLLHPNCQRYFSPDDLASLNSSVPSLCDRGEGSEVTVGAEPEKNKETSEIDGHKDSEDDEESLQFADRSKKDPSLRRFELLMNSGLAETFDEGRANLAGNAEAANGLSKNWLVGFVISMCDSSYASSALGLVEIFPFPPVGMASGGAGGILRDTLADKVDALHVAISTLAALPKTNDSEQHLFENFHSSRTIRKLVLDCPSFAATLWKSALEGKCEMWAHGHSCKVVSAFMESSDSVVRDMAKSELQPLIDCDILKVSWTKLAEKES